MSTRPNCILLGDEALLSSCGQLLLEAGWTVDLVLSTDEFVLEWAVDQGLTAQHPLSMKDIDDLVQKTAHDYLFSIANLRVLPERVISRARISSINFHDGPLPNMRGVNTPTWALLEEHQTHAVTWHEMAKSVDTGTILAQEEFAVDDNETTFTLNTKCFDFALSLFKDLIQSNFVPINSSPSLFRDVEACLYTKRRTPKNRGIVTGTTTRAEFGRLCRAMNFGAGRVPLVYPKIVVGDQVYYVESMEETPSREAGAECLVTLADDIVAARLAALPGQVLEVSTQQPLKPSPITLDEELRAPLSWWFDLLSRNPPTRFPYASRLRDEGDEEAGGSIILNGYSIQSGLALVGHFIARVQSQNSFACALTTNASEVDELPYGAVLLSVADDQLIGSIAAQGEVALKTATAQGAVPLDVVASGIDSWWSPQILIHIGSLLGAKLEFARTNNCSVVIALEDNPQGVEITIESLVSLSKPVEQILVDIRGFADRARSQPEDSPIAQIPLCDKSDVIQLRHEGEASRDSRTSIVSEIVAMGESKPDEIALVASDCHMTYRELLDQCAQFARGLREQGVKLGSKIGIALPRDEQLIVALLGTMQAGACYVPMDPGYPITRLKLIAEDAELDAVVMSASEMLDFEDAARCISFSEIMKSGMGGTVELPELEPSSLAYMIYTSGSTGKPKGVQITHVNVLNFFQGMDERIPLNERGNTWLAVTSMSFDISVLELFWTLARGLKVVLFAGLTENNLSLSKYRSQSMQFGLFYWNVADQETATPGRDQYDLLIKGAQYADTHGYSAVWVPERHFGNFGGLFPNPSICAAAISTQTERVAIRAGSCVLPLHHPIRVAEDWAMIDNLSNGRVGISVASGWMPNDFVIRPESFSDPKAAMFSGLEELKSLWRGQSVSYPAPNGNGNLEIKTLPRPVQAELPVWITTAGNRDSFVRAGELGANILTHLLGQELEDLSVNIQAYRDAFLAGNHVSEPHVTLMLHTFVGQSRDQVREIVREPMKAYLKSAFNLVKDAAWEFPTFKSFSESEGKSLDDYFEQISPDDMDGLLDFAFERYFSRSGLFGSVSDCVALVDRAKEIGVSEIAALVDYGIATDQVLEHLPYLDRVMAASNPSIGEEPSSLSRSILNEHVTHFQCTPSMVKMLLLEEDGRRALTNLDVLMVGGEAFPAELAQELTEYVKGSVLNMYGPTETTVWSAVHEVSGAEREIPIGTPITNTTIAICNDAGQPLPKGVVGELLIGGIGVSPGYQKRPELNEERFVELEGQRFYRTGDLGQVRSEVLYCLGRIDNQVKIQGHRIELDEIEHHVSRIPGIETAIVQNFIRGDGQVLVAFVVGSASKPSAENIREALARELPGYMVPSSIEFIDKVPLTPNGKIDRAQLIFNTGVGADVGRPPETEIESELKVLWESVLDHEVVSVTSSFFEIGGHSIVAARLAQQISKQFDVRFPLRSIFSATTIEEQAQIIEDLYIADLDEGELEDLLRDIDG